MTGFGRREIEIEGKKICIDVKSLNSKQTDINTRIPTYYKEKELEIRKLLSSKLIRGKIEFGLFIVQNESSNACINESAIIAYYEKLNEISQKNSIPMSGDILSSIIKLPEVLHNNLEELKETEWTIVLQAINQSIDHCIEYRKSEGKEIEKDARDKINSILCLLKKVPQYEKERIETIKQRLKDNLANLTGITDIEENRLEQELIYYLEKLDINEEKNRLKKNCDYFLETLNLEESQAKKLAFISQEIGREINTLGSKANHSEMQKIVINMKDELEKVKEQLYNAI
jgi:uncharacterized protein (TIGR00255 family)